MYLVIKIFDDAEYTYGRYESRDRANEVALELQDYGYDVYVTEEK